MRRPPPRRPRVALITVAAAVTVGGVAACADDAPAVRPVAAPQLTIVTTQRCRQPNRFSGVGIVVGDDLVVTAGHLVEGELRALTVGGGPARVVTIDRRTDLAVLSVALEGEVAPTAAARPPAVATVRRPGAERLVAVDRQITLLVDHSADRATYRRDVVMFRPGVVDGESGSAVIDDTGRLVGVVVAGQRGQGGGDAGDEGIAVTVDEVQRLVGDAPTADDLTWPDPPGAC